MPDISPPPPMATKMAWIGWLDLSLVYLVPAWWPAVVAGCISAGIALTFWVIRTRSLVAERAALDRWSAELAAGLRAALDDQLVIQLLAAETALAARSGIGPSRDRT